MALRLVSTLRSRFSYYLGDIIYGANDGLITTFAVVSSVAGAGLSATAIIIVGMASLFADGFSMGASRYLSLKSEQTLSAGASDTYRTPLADGFMTFVAFVSIGAIPLIPFMHAGPTAEIFFYSAALTAGALFVVGAARSFVTTRGALVSGIEMLVIGGVAATIAYGVGAFVKTLVGVAI